MKINFYGNKLLNNLIIPTIILVTALSCTSIDYINLSPDGKQYRSIENRFGIITFNMKAIYEREESDIDDLMKVVNNDQIDYVLFQELFDEDTREYIIEKADRNIFHTVISRVDYNTLPEFLFQDAGLFMMSRYSRIDLDGIDFGCEIINSNGVIHRILDKEISRTNDFLANKSVLGSLFDINDSTKVFLFTAHVQAAGTIEHKLLQLEQIGDFILTAVNKVVSSDIIKNSNNLSVILAGDFNSNAYSPDRFESLMKALHYPRDLHKEFHAENEEYTFRNRSRRYDYIFAYDSLEEIQLKRVEINNINVLDIKNREDVGFSDHLAIKADLSFEDLDTSLIREVKQNLEPYKLSN